jgi:hypothetical protein
MADSAVKNVSTTQQLNIPSPPSDTHDSTSLETLLREIRNELRTIGDTPTEQNGRIQSGKGTIGKGESNVVPSYREVIMSIWSIT